MHKGGNLSYCLTPVKSGFLTFILSEGMQLVDQESSIPFQHSKRFREDKGQIFDVFQDKVTDDQIISSILTGPGLSEVCHRESYIFRLDFFPGFFDHPFGKIQRMNMGPHLRKE